MAEARATRTTIINIHGRQVFDSRGQPTIEVDLQTELGLFRAAVPCGSTTNTYESKEIRDGYDAYQGLSVEKAIKNIHDFLVPGLKGMDPIQQQAVDLKMAQEIDGSQSDIGAWHKKRIGANAIYAVSVAVCQAGAAAAGLPIWQHVANLAGNRSVVLPVPAFHVLDGGKNAENGLLFQEFMVLPTGAVSFTEAMKMGTETYHQLRALIEKKHGADALRVGDTGGFAPPLKTEEEALELLVEAIAAADLTGKIQIAIDAAGHEWYDKATKLYDLGYKDVGNDGTKKISGTAIQKRYTEYCTKYPIISIEDPFDREDWVNNGKLTMAIGESVQIVGDEIYMTNPVRLDKGIADNGTNAILLKPNQVGTVWEAIEIFKNARNDGQFGVMGSTRLGETASTFISDFVVGLSLGQFKGGGIGRMSSMCKYNHFLRIEEELGEDARYAGSSFRMPSSSKKK